MVLGETKGDEKSIITRRTQLHTGVSNSSTLTNTNDNLKEICDDDVFNREGDGGMRVGKAYQAIIPGLIPKAERKPELCAERALLVWSPSQDISDGKMDEYVALAKEKYGYNAEQSLGMLFWHKHDLEKAVLDLSNFTPFPDEWSVEDKVLFEQAFQFHGKKFHYIRQMLPDKSIASLVKYYYSWKKTRSRASLIDRQAHRLLIQREEGDLSPEIGSLSDSDGDEKHERKEIDSTNECQNCGVSCSQLSNSSKGFLCSTCHHYWKKTGNARPTFGAIRVRDSKDKRKFRKPPKGMYINHDDLISIANGPSGQSEAILRHIDDEIINLKRQIQSNKQNISTLKLKIPTNIDAFRQNEFSFHISPRWSNDELLLAVEGIRKFGKDFKTISEILGTKSEVHLRNFFINYRKRFELDIVLREYELEHGPLPTDDDDSLLDSNTSSTSELGLSSPLSQVNNSTMINGFKTDLSPIKTTLSSHMK